MSTLFNWQSHGVISLDLLDAQGRKQVWESHLPRDMSHTKDLCLDELGDSYDLTGDNIRSAIDWGLQRSKGHPKKQITKKDLKAGASFYVRSKIGSYADSRSTDLNFDYLVLPEDSMKLVQEFRDACRNRYAVLSRWGFSSHFSGGKGIVGLFSGDSGTGKTLTAQILAKELNLHLFIVSVPSIMSKWVGETEKNIREVFRQAKTERGLLLFDEADSLFAKRVKVERSSDRFQNTAVNILLQEIEAYDGVSLLTTNMEVNIDRAFERRILFKIDFPMPEEKQRKKIWETLIPPATPVQDDVDFNALAREFQLSGGQIKNAIIRAAYRCRAAGYGLTYDQLWKAAQQQTVSAGRLYRSVG